MKKALIKIGCAVAVILLSGCLGARLYRQSSVRYNEDVAAGPYKQILLLVRKEKKHSTAWRGIQPALASRLAANGIALHVMIYSDLDAAVYQQIADTVAAYRTDFILRLENRDYTDHLNVMQLGVVIRPGNNMFRYSESSFTFLGYATDTKPYRLVWKCGCTEIKTKQEQQVADCLLKGLLADKLAE